jgi:hypothetical protein
MTMRKRTLAFLLAAAVSAPQLALAADSSICIRRNDIRAWSSPARRQLVLENYAHKKVILKMSGSCEGFGTYDSFQITGPNESNIDCIVPGDVVRTNWAGEPGECSITTISPYDGPVHPHP